MKPVGQTGVSASITGNTLKLQTREYGSNSFVQVTRISGDADFASVSRTAGTNASVSVGGQTGQTDGLRVTFNTSGISGEFTLTAAGNVAGGAIAFAFLQNRPVLAADDFIVI